MIEPLAWDSAFFGLRVGRLRPGAADSTDVATLTGFDCVYVELDAADPDALRRWKARGARLVDTRVELVAAVTHDSRPATVVEAVPSWSPQDREAAAALAVELSRWSRFGQDPAFASRAADLYRCWIDAAFAGTHGTLACRDAGEIVALLTHRLDGSTAWIELLVVREDARGRGFGSALVSEHLRRAAASGAHWARVRTQQRNAGAVRTYERAGFTVAATTHVLHWWLR